MNEKSKTDQYIDHLNSHILPFIDYSELQTSYDTDMVYAKGILNRLHDAMISIYGGEQLGRMDEDDGFVVIPGVVRGRESGNVCLALLELDISSSGEHWGTSYLCKYGVIAQGGIDKVSNNDSVLKSEIKEINAAYLPYDYGYTAIIPGDIHIDTDMMPYGIKTVLDDFRNYRSELLFESEPFQDDASVSTGDIKGVTEVRISAREFENKMKELLPGASDKAVRMLINYAVELDENGTHPKGAFFSESYVAYNLAVHQFGRETAGEVLKMCEESCFDPWEVLDASRLMAENVPPSEIMRKAIDGELDLLPKQRVDIEAGLAALQADTLDVPNIRAEKISVLEQIREAAKTPKEPHKDKPAQDKSGPEL